MYTLRFEVLLPYVQALLWALVLSLFLTGTSLLLGTCIGMVMAFLRVYGPPAVRRIASAYVELFRNIPLLLIIIFIYFGFPLMGVRFLDNIASVVFAMSIYAGAYLTEIFRAGIESVENQYVEAGKSIGLTNIGVAKHVIIPLMFAQALPALGNMMISLFKDSSLASAAGVTEITFVGRMINTDTWRIVEAWSVVACLYLGVSYILALLMRGMEWRFLRWR